jgi:hypothetical protein
VRGLSSGSRSICLRVAGRLLRQKFGSIPVAIQFSVENSVAIS